MRKRKKTIDNVQNTAQPFHRLVPNMITICALCTGLTSIQFAINERWEAAVIAIVIAAFLDAFDGAVARLLNAQSQLGAELDSLSDFLCFGIAPALVLYLWTLQDIGRFGWMICLIFAVAGALRLARFNAMSKEETAEANPLNGYFVGIPAPTGAGMTILPLILSFLVEDTDYASYAEFLRSPYFAGGWALFFGAMMVSRVPTFSTKQLKLPPKMVVPLLAVFGLMVAGLINAPWPTLSLMGVVYALSIPAAVIHYLIAKKKLTANA